MSDNMADIAVLTIIPKIELKAILHEVEQKWPTAIKKVAAGSTYLYSVKTSRDWDIKIAIRAIYEAGNLNSALETTSMLSRFRPKFSFLCGIAGNLNHAKCNLGDVIVSGSYAFKAMTRMSEGEEIEYTMPRIPNVSPKMQDLAQRVFFDNEVVFDDKDAQRYLNGHKLDDPTHLEIGKIFCWDLVLDCDSYRRQLIREDREYRAVEMEAAGFFRAIESFEKLYRCPVNGLIFRGLSDDASGKAKSDKSNVQWRGYAARNAARAMVTFIDSLAPEDCRDTSF